MSVIWKVRSPLGLVKYVRYNKDVYKFNWHLVRLKVILFIPCPLWLAHLILWIDKHF